VLLWPSAALAQGGDADPAALVQLPGDDAGSVACGDYTVSWANLTSYDVSNPGSVTLRAKTSHGQTVFNLTRPLTPGEKVIPLWCGDLLGNGGQALGFETFTGGAHCCFSATVVSLDGGGQPILTASLGNGGLTIPTQLDGGGPLELPAASDVFAYFADLSFAASPFLPMIFAFDGAHYVEATRQFPDRIKAEIDQARADLAVAVARPVPANEPAQFVYQAQESAALRLFGLHVLLGDADQALPAIEASLAKPAADWLAANAPAARDAMATRYNLDDTQ
jgi:hypothetical protein